MYPNHIKLSTSVGLRHPAEKFTSCNGVYERLKETNANEDSFYDKSNRNQASDVTNGNIRHNSFNGNFKVLESQVTPEVWSKMDSSNSVHSESGDTSSDHDTNQPSASQHHSSSTTSSNSHTNNHSFSTQPKVCYANSDTVVESGVSPKRRHHNIRASSSGQRTQHKNLSQKKTTNFTLDLEQIELIDDDLDEPSTSVPRKPHFLDEDYHLQRSDVCRIPKPHFLDHSPSPDDDRLSDITNPHFLDDVPEDRGDRSRSLRRKEHSKNFDQNTHLRQESDFVRDKLEDRHSLERRQRNGSYHNELLPGQASTSNDRTNSQVFDGGWQGDMWHNQDSCSVKSFSSAGSGNASSGAAQLGPKVDCVYSLLSLLSLSADSNADMSEYLLEMSRTVESCIAMRQSGCIPLLVQLIHSKLSRASRNKAARALHNMIHAQPDDKSGRREARVLRLLEHVWDYCQFLEDLVASFHDEEDHVEDDMAKHPVQSVAALMKLSFDEEHRHVMCQLGGLQSLATLVTIDQSAHGSLIENEQCVTMRKYSGMALTNLTFGDGNNKALLCSFKDFMTALVDQLQSPNDDMRQVTAAVLRNLSWRADTASKKILREVGTVKGLTVAAMTGHKEATLKSVLSALWNLTAHCSLNKVDICSVEGALAFLVDMLSFNAPSKTLAIIENAGGILRNVSSHIAIREDYRQILREHNCLKVLLQQLKSPSLTIVSNSCGTLWNLSARCQQDQQFLWDHGAVPMLRSLIHSKHKMIAMGSSAALKNLLNSKPGKSHIMTLDSTARGLNLPVLPTLGARKQKALEQELDQNLSETCENIEPVTSPSTSNRDEKLLFSAAERHLAMNIEKHRMSSSSPLMGHLASQISLSHSSHFGGYLSCSNTLLLQSSLQKGHMSRTMLHGKYENVNRSESRDSVTSTHSDSVYERVARNNKIPNHSSGSEQRLPDKARGSCNSVNTASSRTDRDFIKRYSKEGGLMKYDRVNGIPNRHQSDMARNNFSELTYDENETCDQPIDYSKKYSETKSSDPQSKIGEYPDSNSLKVSNIKEKKTDKPDKKSNNAVNYADYQETDLDQPTDYSLRYAEDQSDVTSDLSDGRPASIHEDTIKHFCTEGTPYETPINFSTATSMSDLRAIGAGLPIANKPVKAESVVLNNDDALSVLSVKQTVEIMSQSDEKDTCSLEEAAKHDNDRVLTSSRKVCNQVVPQPTTSITYDSKFSSGMISPEKPVNYCEEGTPGYFSRVSSLSSLEEGRNGTGDDDNWNTERPDETELAGSFTPPTADVAEGVQPKEKESGKVVTFGTSPGVLNYAEETPLMFSRCSSLESLSGCSVPDQPDDVGSVVSEFSRLTSGCVSPSEIPDSPTHSPLPRGDSSVLTAVPNQGMSKTVNAKSPPQHPNRLRSVFEDEISTFKCEHTPVEFSTATSLSSLTIDDEPSVKVPFSKPFDPDKRSCGDGSSNPDEHPLPRTVVIPLPSDSLSDDSGSNTGDSHHGDEEQAGVDLLAACISQGVQSGIKVRTSNVINISGSIITSSPNKTQHQNPLGVNPTSDGVQPSMDTLLTYCTEDTPALLSKAGSHSNLSTLSFLENEEEDHMEGVQLRVNNVNDTSDAGLDVEDKQPRDYSDDSSNLSEDSGNLLAECIRSGMPKNIKEEYEEPRSTPKKNQVQNRMDSFLRIPQSGLPSYMVSRDEVESYAVEGSPFHHSLSSSLSDLTVDSHSGFKARLTNSNILGPPLAQHINSKRDSEPPVCREISPHMSPSGSLSSVDLGSDDGQLLSMVIQAGMVGKLKDESTSYMKDNFTNQVKSPPNDEIKPQESSVLDDKSEDQPTILTRQDSLSSLSVDSIGSNDGEQALFEQCIKSGMPKVRPNRKWDDMHSKTLDKNFKARSADRNDPDVHKNHSRNHKSLDRSKDESKGRNLKRDPEFESLVAAGAFRSCSQKLTKTEEDIMERELLERVIYSGMPKKKDRVDSTYQDVAIVPNPPIHSQPNIYCTPQFDESFTEDLMKKEKGNLNSDVSKNVQVTSVVADNSLSCSPGSPSALQVAIDVKTVVEVGNTAKNTKTEEPFLLNHNILNKIQHKQVILDRTAPELSAKKPLLNGEASEDSPCNSTMNVGSDLFYDQVDGNNLPKLASDLNSSFNDSALFDKSNEFKALDVSSYYNDSVTSDLNLSNESCANLFTENPMNGSKNLSQSKNSEKVSSDLNQSCLKFSELDLSIMNVSSKTLVQSSIMNSSKPNQTDPEFTMVESVTEKDMYSSSGKMDKHSSTDTWNENTCPNDISFPTVSGSVPMISSLKSDVGDEITCAGALPDLLEESVVLSDGLNQPDLTNQLSHNMQCLNIEDTSKFNPKSESSDLKNLTEHLICTEMSNLSMNTICKEPKILSTDSVKYSSISDDTSKFASMSHSTIIEKEAASLARTVRESSYDFSCLTQSGHSLHSLDLDNVKPPSQMGSLLSLTHSLSGHWEENHCINFERDKLHSSLTKRSINKIPRKKSLPMGLMVKRALGYSHSNQGSSENLDFNGMSNIENIKPPSEMDDVFDMENSMISVASIVSEVADTHDDDTLTQTIVFDLKQPVNNTRLINGISSHIDIDNINPPSLFDELTESTLENDNEDDNCITQTLANCPEIPSGSDSGTPIPSDFGSSAESTPRKIKSTKKYLTPKQKRQIARDRYKTYTIAAEMAIQEEENRRRDNDVISVPDTEDINYNQFTPNQENKDKKGKSNPKQRRQENRERYQTQTVNISNIVNTQCKINKDTIKDPEIEALKRRLEAKKSIKQKRLDNSERFRTRTIEESIALSSETNQNDIETPPSCSSTQMHVSEYNHTQLALDATRAFDFPFQEFVDESLIVDLDCETISLVSNEDDSELNSLRMKTFTKSFRNYLPVIESPTAVDKCIEKNLKNMSHSSIQIDSFTYSHKIQNANEVNGYTCDLNSLECDQNSGTESADQNQFSDSEAEISHVKIKPKIVKPNIYERELSVDSNESIDVEENVPKAIRGRKKALYVSPYKRNGAAPKKSPSRTSHSVKSTKSSIVSKLANGVTSKNVNGCKTPTNLTRISYTSAKSTINILNRNSPHINKSKSPHSRNKSPKNISESILPKPTLVRQGTFTKEESSIVSSSNSSPRTPEKRISPNSKLTKPGTILKNVVNTSPSRLPQPPVKGASAGLRPPLKTANSNESANTKTSTSRTSSNLSTRVSTTLKSSSSNQSLQSNDSGKTITLLTKVSGTTKCSGSSSSSSISSVVSTSKPQSKDVTSKIANLWKKVEQSKKTSAKPDTRVWISNNLGNSSQQFEETANSVRENPSVSKLIRSSTFEGPPKAISSIPTPPKQKSSIAIRVSQSPNSRYGSKVPVVRTSSTSGGVSSISKRGKT